VKKGWEKKRLGEILCLEYGKPLEESARKPHGKYPVYGANGEKDRSDKFYYDKPTIIVGRKGSAGEINLTEPKFWPLDVTYFVTFNENQHDLRFLYYQLVTLNLPSLAKGVKPGINRNEIYSQIVKIPPLPEQRRIVGILDEAFDGITKAKANAEKNLQNARELFESHLNEVFSKRDEGWVEKNLGDVCDFRGGGTPSKAVKRYWKGRIPWVSPKDMKFDVVSDSIDHISTEAIEDSATSLIPKGAVLIVVRSGILARIVPIAITGRELTINQDIKALCPNNMVETRFLYDLLESKMPILLSMVSRGATVHRLMTEQIRSLRFPLPPKAEQRRIVGLVTLIRIETQRLESIYQRKLTTLDELKKSLLQQAFSGNL